MAAIVPLEETCETANLSLLVGRQDGNGSLPCSDWLTDYLDSRPDLAQAGRNLGPSVTDQQPCSGVVLVQDSGDSSDGVARGSESRTGTSEGTNRAHLAARGLRARIVPTLVISWGENQPGKHEPRLVKHGPPGSSRRSSSSSAPYPWKSRH